MGVAGDNPPCLKDLPLKVAYDTDEDNILQDFYNPVLSCGTQYDRLAGFFSSSALSAAARGVAGLIRNGGRMRLIASPRLSPEDVGAIEIGSKDTEAAALQAALSSLEDIEQLLSEDQREALAWLVRNEHLEVRLAIPLSQQGKPLPEAELAESGMFHQKVGIVQDQDGHRVSFSGSVNETLSGWTRNIEEFKVFRSWIPGELDHLESDQRKFEKYWQGKARQTVTIDVSSAIHQRLIEYIGARKPGANPSPSAPRPLWRHQHEALSVFFEKRAGILEMATGTGKTQTALSIAKQLLNEKRIESIVVASVGNDLLQQWYGEILSGLGDDRVLIRREFNQWKEGRSFFLTKSSLPTVLVTSYDNLGVLLDADRVARISSSLLICDEIHNAGSQQRARALRGKLEGFPYRLGLSATPERPYDEEGSAFIEEAIGPVIYRFGLEDAIRAGILCQFDYIPLLYELEDEDRGKIRQAHARHATRKRTNPHARIEELYRDLANVRKESKAKLPLFARYLSQHPTILNRSVIFVANMEYGHLVQEIIHRWTKDYHTYYGDDDEENLQRFARGELNTLITCKRISEGIDVRSIRTVILFASDRARLQTTQRIGRCLRNDPAQPEKRAQVVDFVLRDDVQPSEKSEDNDYTPVDADRYDWLTGLSRIKRGSANASSA